MHLMLCFQNFAGGPANKNRISHGLFETALCVDLINELIAEFNQV